MNEFQRIGGVYFDPKRAFADIAARPRWWVPLVLIIVFSLSFMFTYSKRVGWEQMVRQSIETNARMREMPAQQREQAISQGAKFAGIMTYVGVVIGTPVMFLATAGIMLLVFNLMLGAQVSFRQAFAVVAYSFLTGLVSAILAVIVMFLKSAEDFNLQNPLAFNLGAFLDPTTSPKWLVSLGTSLDLFSLWTVLLLATGMQAASGRISWKKAVLGVALPWVVLIVLKVGWAAAFA